MKIFKLFAASILGFASLCAAAPTTEPTDAPTSRPSRFYARPDIRKAWRALGANSLGVRDYTQAEWEEMMVFMRQYSPERAYYLDNIQLPHDSPIRREAIGKFRAYKFTRDHFHDIANDLLRRFTLEDDLFDLTLKATADQGTDAIDLREKIHDKVAEIVQLEFNERQARIDRLQSMLDDEKSKLAASESAKEDMIDRRTNAIFMRLGHRNFPQLSPTTRPEHFTTNVDAPAGSDPVMDVSQPTNPPANPPANPSPDSRGR